VLIGADDTLLVQQCHSVLQVDHFLVQAAEVGLELMRDTSIMKVVREVLMSSQLMHVDS
jgi:hypothetical protein